MKKFISAIFAVFLTFLFSFSAFAALPGDMNGDGRLTAADARQILRFASALDQPNNEQKLLADVNSDGKLNAADARKVLRISASLESAVQTENLTLSSNTSSEKLSANEIFEKGCEFAVEILTYNEKGTALTIGSGIFVGKNTVVTNYHVVDGAYYAKIKTYDGKTYDVRSVLGYDSKKDIAILETNAEHAVIAIKNDNVKVGDIIYTLGSSKGLTGTFTVGNVSYVNRRLSEMNNDVDYIQITAPVSEGNSGGPVLDEMGNVIGIVSLTHDEGQNLNFAIPIKEVEEIDISSPVTLSELHGKADDDNDFTGSVVLANPGITLKKGGTALVYAVVSASEEYSLVCESDNDLVKAEIGRNYGGINVVYVFALAEAGSAEVKIYISGQEEISSTLNVTIGEEAPVFYNGIQGFVPDFGVLAGIAPEECDENTLDGKNAYSFAYSFDSLNDAGISSEDSINAYRKILEENGYSFVSSTEDKTSVVFYSEKEKTTVTFGFSADENGEYYMYVLIIR